MLSVKSLINYLDVKQEKLPMDEKNVKLTKDLNESFSYIFDNMDGVEYYDIKFGRKTNINNFLLKLFFSLNSCIYFMKPDDQQRIIINFYKKLIIELDEKNLYYKFYYNLDRKMNRNNIQSIIYNLLHTETIGDNTNEYPLIQYIIDYLGINLACFHVDNQFNLVDGDSHELYMSNRFENKINRFIPMIILIKHKSNYYNVSLGGNNIFKYSENKRVIDNCFRFFNISDDNENINNFTYSQLKEYFVEKKGDIKKISQKTHKVINKTKEDLLLELKHLLK